MLSLPRCILCAAGKTFDQVSVHWLNVLHPRSCTLGSMSAVDETLCMVTGSTEDGWVPMGCGLGHVRFDEGSLGWLSGDSPLWLCTIAFNDRY